MYLGSVRKRNGLKTFGKMESCCNISLTIKSVLSFFPQKKPENNLDYLNIAVLLYDSK